MASNLFIFGLNVAPREIQEVDLGFVNLGGLLSFILSPFFITDIKITVYTRYSLKLRAVICERPLHRKTEKSLSRPICDKKVKSHCSCG